MKIDLDLNNQAVREYNSRVDIPQFSKPEQNIAVRFDKTGVFTDNDAYGKHGKTKDDIMKMAENIDVATAEKYMTVLANTLSEEDYKKAMDEGFDPAKMGGEEAVTIIDHIKTVMAESGQVIAGYNDDISSDKLDEITGSAVSTAEIKRKMESSDIPATDANVKQVNEALAMMTDIKELPEGSIKYMVDNNLEPTIENIYTSRYSAMDDGSRQARGYYAEDTSGYYAKKADGIDWDQLLPQVEKSVEQMKLEDMTKEEAVDNAKWLLEKGIPVTEEKIENLGDIKSISFPVKEEQIVDASIRAIGEGKKAKEANLSSNNKTVYKEAKELLDRIGQTRGREEARLQMTLAASMRMIRQGVDVKTTELSMLVDELKEKEKEIYNQFFGEGTVEELESKADIFDKTIDILESIPNLPAATVGRMVVLGEDSNLQNIGRVGNDLKNRFDSASNSYETMMTAPRKDLGDSIQKAFRNVDDILKDLRLDTSEENRRAVRILGYNNMVINREEIERISELDAKIQNVVKNLTPAKTLQLIRDNFNPLTADIDELTEKIDEMDNTVEARAEKYSQFLYKLEQSNEITEDERSSYIGIYRMLYQLEKTDYASIGNIAQTGIDLTFGNLLTGVRNSKANINVKIDDDFGFLNKSVKKGISITDQIEAAFNEHIGPKAAEEIEIRYQKEKLDSLRDVAGDYDAETVEELIRYAQSASPDNMEAMQQFLHYPNEFFRSMKNFAKRLDERRAGAESAENKLMMAIDKFSEKMTDFSSAAMEYNELTYEINNMLDDAITYAADSMLDIKSITLMNKQLTLATRLSMEENYHVPVMVGDNITDINVKLLHGEDTGLVITNFETEELGAVRGEIRLYGDRADVLIVMDDRSVRADVESVGSIFSKNLLEEGLDNKINYMTANPKSPGKYSKKNADNNNEAVDTAALYKVAKLFISSVKEAGNRG